MKEGLHQNEGENVEIEKHRLQERDFRKRNKGDPRAMERSLMLTRPDFLHQETEAKEWPGQP